jgi:hypothetical protein
MAKSKSQNKRIFEIILIVFVVLSIGLILADMTTNLVHEIAAQDRMVYSVQEVEPTPVPTLTAEEREELFSAPVGEEGNE